MPTAKPTYNTMSWELYKCHIYSTIRQVFTSLEWLQIAKSVLWNFASGEPGLVDRVLALHAGSRGFDSHHGHMSELFFRSNRPGYPHPVSSELEISGIRVAVGDCSVTERRRWRPPYQTGKTVHVHAKHYKHNEDGRTAPGVCGNGSVPLSHSGNVVTRIGIHTHTWNFALIWVSPFLNNPQDLDLSYKLDLDFWDCFGRKKTLSYNQRNAVSLMWTDSVQSWDMHTCS